MCQNKKCELSSCSVPYGYCHCGCGEKTNVVTKNHTERNLVAGTYRLFNKNHDKRNYPFEYAIDKETDCWIWQRGLDKDGYGKMYLHGRAPRYYYEQKYGKIPDGLEIDHLCRNRPCVNPDHLEPVTHAENMRRRSKEYADSVSKRRK